MGWAMQDELEFSLPRDPSGGWTRHGVWIQINRFSRLNLHPSFSRSISKLKISTSAPRVPLQALTNHPIPFHEGIRHPKSIYMPKRLFIRVQRRANHKRTLYRNRRILCSRYGGVEQRNQVSEDSDETRLGHAYASIVYGILAAVRNDMSATGLALGNKDSAKVYARIYVSLGPLLAYASQGGANVPATVSP